MALTSEFLGAVRANNLLRVRIMLKDSLLVDKSFNQFTEMRRYAESSGADFWMEKTDELEMRPKTEWNEDLMNFELTRLVNDFTKERLVYCQSIIEKVYGINSVPVQAYTASQAVPREQTKTSPAGNLSGERKAGGSGFNNDDYHTILHSVARMNRILKENKTAEGRIWTYNDIESIQAAADRISRACKNIKARRR